MAASWQVMASLDCQPASLTISSVYTGYLALGVLLPGKGRGDTHQREMSKGKWMGRCKHFVIVPRVQKTLKLGKLPLETISWFHGNHRPPKCKARAYFTGLIPTLASKGTGRPGGSLSTLLSWVVLPVTVSLDLPSGEVPVSTPMLVDLAPP